VHLNVDLGLCRSPGDDTLQSESCDGVVGFEFEHAQVVCVGTVGKIVLETPLGQVEVLLDRFRAEPGITLLELHAEFPVGLHRVDLVPGEGHDPTGRLDDDVVTRFGDDFPGEGLSGLQRDRVSPHDSGREHSKTEPDDSFSHGVSVVSAADSVFADFDRIGQTISGTGM